MMGTLDARADWESVGDKWFRKTQQYTEVFDEDLDLDNYLVAGAPYAGALGTITIPWPGEYCNILKARMRLCTT